MKKRNYKKEDIQMALDLYKEGATFIEIANTLECGISSVQRWVRKAGLERRHIRHNAPSVKLENTGSTHLSAKEPINNMLLIMARGNDLSKWVGRSITSLQPREIYEFLKAINLQGELKVTQVVKI